MDEKDAGQGYLALTPKATLKLLEAPYVYLIDQDELYEVNDETLEFLSGCNGQNRGAMACDDEFIEVLPFGGDTRGLAGAFVSSRSGREIAVAVSEIPRASGHLPVQPVLPSLLPDKGAAGRPSPFGRPVRGPSIRGNGRPQAPHIGGGADALSPDLRLPRPNGRGFRPPRPHHQRNADRREERRAARG